MKRFFFYLASVIAMFSSFSYVSACPTCFGRIDDESPPFFSDEAYQTANSQGWRLPDDIADLEELNEDT